MNCAQRTGVYALFISLSVLSNSIAIHAKGNKDRATIANSNTYENTAAPEEFQWNDHNKLSWNDFKGPVKAANEESAAATHCGIGFKTTNASGKQQVIVYNTFYTNRSWVRPDAKIPQILDHEQGHFDLCEIYTRKLRSQMDNFDFNVPDVKSALMEIYASVKNDYETRQQAYEAETTHGTNTPEQRRWQNQITKELSAN